MGGRDLDIVVEYYDRVEKRWILLSRDLEKEFDREATLDRLLKATREEYRVNEWDGEEDDIENEAESMLCTEYSVPLSADNDLLHYLFGEPQQGRYDILALQRGLPLNSTIPLNDWQQSIFTFFSAEELKTVDWRQRIDRRAQMSFKEYREAFGIVSPSARTRGQYKTINEATWLQADEEAKRALLTYDLHIYVNRPAYLANPNQLEDLMKLLDETSMKLSVDPHDLRVTFVMSQ